MDIIEAFLLFLEYVKRFRELGGGITTTGSDAHDKTRVGQNANETMEMIGNVRLCV